MRRSTSQWKKGVFSEKGGGNSVNGGFGKDFYRKGKSVKRSGPFSEPPDSEKWKVKSCCPHSLPENQPQPFKDPKCGTQPWAFFETTVYHSQQKAWLRRKECFRISSEDLHRYLRPRCLFQSIAIHLPPLPFASWCFCKHSGRASGDKSKWRTKPKRWFSLIFADSCLFLEKKAFGKSCRFSQKTAGTRSTRQISGTALSGRPGHRTMEMIGGSSPSYLARTPCFPFFWTLFNRGGIRRAFRLPGEGGDHFHCTVEPSPGQTRCRRLAFFPLGLSP